MIGTSDDREQPVRGVKAVGPSLSERDKAAAAARGAASGGSRRYLVVRLVTFVLVLAAWEVVGSMVNPIFLSTPSKIAVALVAMIRNGQLLVALQLSLLGIALGYTAAIAIGVPLGIAMGRSRMVEAIVEPYANALYVTPRVALIPLLLIWFGIGFEAQVVVIFLSSVFPIIINSYAGVRDISANLVDTARAFCASERQLFTEVILPAAVPFIMTGLRLGIGQAVIGMVVAQMFLALSGLGKLLVNYGDFFKTDYVFAVVIVIGLLGVALTEIVKRVEQRFAHWKESERAFL
ncbi:MAG: ABC transporter permease [Chloroflexi bacterium]|nr:ABC transporter permease [Chloroflexota bacterium]